MPTVSIILVYLFTSAIKVETPFSCESPAPTRVRTASMIVTVGGFEGSSSEQGMKQPI